MANRGINLRLSAESIQDTNDVKTWGRDVDVNLEQLRDAIVELRDVDDKQQKGINRNLKFLMIAIAMFGSAFAVVVVLFGIPQIIERLFGGAP